jgi:hypothetical protein
MLLRHATPARNLPGIIKGSTLKLALKFGDERPTELNSEGGFLLVFEKKK